MSLLRLRSREILDADGTPQKAFNSERRGTTAAGIDGAPGAQSTVTRQARARVVLACAAGLDNQAAANKLRGSKGMVGKWRGRFLKARLEGLNPDQARHARLATTRWSRS